MGQHAGMTADHTTSIKIRTKKTGGSTSRNKQTKVV